MSPITDEQFDAGKAVETKALSEAMDPTMAYTTPETAELIGKSWGIAKKLLLAGIAEGVVHQRKIGRSIYFRYYPGGVPEELLAEIAAEEEDVEVEPEDDDDEE